jgi:hypothetical protein
MLMLPYKRYAFSFNGDFTIAGAATHPLICICHIFAGHPVLLRQPTSNLRSSDDAQDGDTGVCIWDAAVFLSLFLQEHAVALVRGKKVLELGAGNQATQQVIVGSRSCNSSRLHRVRSLQRGSCRAGRRICDRHRPTLRTEGAAGKLRRQRTPSCNVRLPVGLERARSIDRSMGERRYCHRQRRGVAGSLGAAAGQNDKLCGKL